jgi:hypothetical protein
VSIAKAIELSGEEDTMVWQSHSSGVYSSQLFYQNRRGLPPTDYTKK